ncbi:MAG TPA: translation initiation factor Sui1 [Burkholderiaceae bacterium]|nr:translation initiation factor Sui1 [Burkholderiaceae bacterium]
MRKTGSGSGGLVYSTESGRMCPGCRQPVATCVCGKPQRPAGDGVGRVSREKAGRGGKTVTLVRGLALDEAGLAALGKKLRSACGAGGAAKDGVLEIQGDHVERVLELLAREGHTARRSGG